MTASAHTPPPHEHMLQMIFGVWVSRAIHAAAELGLADHFNGTPQTVDQLAAATNAHAPSLYRLLRALAGVGIFAETEPQTFVTTPLAETLRSDVPGSLRSVAKTLVGHEHFQPWGEIVYSVKTGKTAFEKVYGMPVWQHFHQHPHLGRDFNDAMAGFTHTMAQAFLAAYDFSKFTHLVDVGGGNGALLGAILHAHPELRGTVFDQPTVVAETRERLEREGLADRCGTVGGSFFEEIPAGGDAYMMKWIIHDWNDDESIAIMRNIRTAMPENGTLLVIEAAIPEDNSPAFGKFLDLNMLMMTTGRERTPSEYGRLFEAAGFTVTRVVPTASPMCIVEGVPVG